MSRKAGHYFLALSSIVFGVLFVFSAENAVAQTSPMGTASGPTLVALPAYPGAHEKVRISLDDYSFNTVGSTIRWYLNGVEKTDMKNERAIEITSGSIGEKTSVEAVLEKSGALPLRAKLQIIPIEVDLVVESDTYVPAFYKGKALPSAGGPVRLIAVVHDGGAKPDTAYTYKWSEEGEVIFGGPLKGKNSITMNATLYDEQYMTVEVLNDDGAVMGEKSVLLKSYEPELYFYEQSPLRGLFEKSIVSPMPMIGNEITVYGEPYYLDASIDASAADFSWRVNGGETITENISPNALTLRHVGGEGRAEVGLSILTKKRVPQFLERTFTLFFE